MRIRKNNYGITLVELIISMAIAAIVFSIIAIMINTAAKGFKRSNEDVNLQMEAQIAINQLSTIVMGASGDITSNTTVLPDKKFLISYNTGSDSYALYLKVDTDKLYLIPAANITAADGIDPTASVENENKYLMAEYVDDISIETGTKSPKIYIKFVLGDSSFTMTKKVTIRNK